MSSNRGWFVVIVFVVLVLAVAACSPQIATPTPKVVETEVPTTEPTAEVIVEPEETKDTTSASSGVSYEELQTDADDWRALGSPDAPVTIVEYSDFQCPYCARYASDAYRQILSQYVATGKVQYMFRHFPLYSIHPQAQKAGEAAECAGEQGKYWEMHDALFSSQEQWSGSATAVQTLKDLAGGLGLDQAAFSTCLDEDRYADRVRQDSEDGLAKGITGTPSFLINGVELSGAQPFAAFKQQIDFFLAGGSPPTLEVAADSYRSMGEPDAQVVVTEFSDYQCPACGQVEAQVIPELIARYVDTGKARFVYRQFPLESLHPNAPQASVAALCAGEQGEFWAMHSQLFSASSEWGAQGADPKPFFMGYAEDMNLDTELFASCLDSEEAALAVQSDMMAGQTLGVNATPTFFVNELPIRGGLPIDDLGVIIDYVAVGGIPPEIVPQGDDWHVRGDLTTARAIVVAFADYANTESGRHARKVLPGLVDEYIDSGELLYIIHPWASDEEGESAQAAGAAECAGQQGKFWEMHDRIFEEQSNWIESEEPAALFDEYAESLALDGDEFAECLESDWVGLRVKAGRVVGALYGVPSAPVYLFNNGQAQEATATLEQFQSVIDSIINQ